MRHVLQVRVFLRKLERQVKFSVDYSQISQELEPFLFYWLHVLQNCILMYGNVCVFICANLLWPNLFS